MKHYKRSTNVQLTNTRLRVSQQSTGSSHHSEHIKDYLHFSYALFDYQCPRPPNLQVRYRCGVVRTHTRTRTHTHAHTHTRTPHWLPGLIRHYRVVTRTDSQL
ncbi:hypothetical protein E2C01_023297 [Portunus trituberculatus]|uniref:Uncharacterized protein n=1 Tax=Portunus trituberculatus TaxID=210409 RepID=A0A5B7EAS0_PORTR|nr:hypothetical protein [Portunus trituberculatus]